MEEAPVALGAVWENVALRQWARVAASTERYGRVRLLLWAGDGQMRRAQNAPVRTWSMQARRLPPDLQQFVRTATVVLRGRRA